MKAAQTENIPWLNGRENPDVKPTYKIIARSITRSGDSVVTLHKAGDSCVINYYIRDLVTQNNIMQQMDIKEAELLRWVVNSEVTDPLAEIKKD